MCSMLCDITATVCKILCCYNRKSYGSLLPAGNVHASTLRLNRLSNTHTRTGVELPRTPSEITPEFLTIAFHSYGTYPATVTVTSMELLKAPRTGLLSDIHRITYKPWTIVPRNLATSNLLLLISRHVSLRIFSKWVQLKLRSITKFKKCFRWCRRRIFRYRSRVHPSLTYPTSYITRS